MRRFAGFAALLLVIVHSALAAQEYAVTGMVLTVDRSRNIAIVRHARGAGRSGRRRGGADMGVIR